jgi:hypothetical protein
MWKIINFIITAFKRVLSFFRGWTKSKKNNAPNDDAPYQYDNADWYEVSYNKGKSNMKEIENEIENNDDNVILTDIYYLKTSTDLRIVMPLSAYYSKPCQMCKTDGNRYLTLIKDNDFVCLYPTLNIQGKVIKVFTAHTYAMVDKDSNLSTCILNPQVIISPTSKSTIPMVKVPKNKLATIMTSTITSGDNYILETVPTTVVNVMHLVKGKPKIGTIALIFTIAMETELVWSGSIVRYENSLFIISNRTMYEDSGVIKLVAFAIASHNIQITTEHAFK